MGQNGTIFDYKNTRNGMFSITYSEGDFCINNKCEFIFENIIFQNFNNFGDKLLSPFQIITEVMNFRLDFQNCIFRNNRAILLKYLKTSECPSLNKYSLVNVENCHFENNKDNLFYLVLKYFASNMKINLCQNLVLKNSTFFNNENITILQSGKFIIDDCIFKDNKGKINEAHASLIDSIGNGNQVIIKNSKIFNNFMDEDIPLILIKISNLIMENCSIINSYSGANHLFKIEHSNSIIVNNTIFEGTSTVFNSLNSEITIDDSMFKNYSIMNSFPLVDSGENSSLLKINTNERKNSEVNVENLKIYSCQSNGPLIKFNGIENRIFIKSSDIYENIAYGPLIENSSKQVIL
ncbi:hypothetical protein PIROE2DRAFT_4123 [Piromyces sp. E2]|nr:hypothetical protein PIROE2DRAFT_4123 [Piromyces sp. E2]|eukprot:OUM68243.1 hypothetical protein PIROE2DRAFT_4123 [Piromyces sp. E2]